MMKGRKKALLAYLHSTIAARITEGEREVASTREARNSDTKSTAGDKHEVGRAMAQIELEQQETQLHRSLQLRAELERINPDRDVPEIGLGSLVITDRGTYFLAIGLGQVTFESEVYFVISLSSPVGILLRDKAMGDSITFNQQNIHIQAVH